MSGNKKAQERLLEAGYNAGRAFIDGAKSKTIAEAEFREAPLGVVMRLFGPTTDFIMGRIFEAAMDEAIDKVVKRDAEGFPILDPSRWANNELKKVKAENQFHQSNCALIR
ncbi:MAG: hypothetical protein IT469_04570 [Pseudomonadales bacterium]|nr:hypothetical protein [Pseudomonadales bacterium]